MEVVQDWLRFGLHDAAKLGPFLDYSNLLHFGVQRFGRRDAGKFARKVRIVKTVPLVFSHKLLPVGCRSTVLSDFDYLRDLRRRE